ncbi:MAG: TGS domain-containing protein [Desulfurococcales archaeon]|nr:TGS domain-containing protein [Desulfurococcales archaeon]
MPANLPPEAKAKYAKYLDAKTTEEKIRALEEFISAVPKHKGTENLMLWARKKLAQLRQELEDEKRRKRSGGGGIRYMVQKTGAAQVAVIGPPNTGKSTLVHTLTGAKTVVADYPYATRLPAPGMLKFEDIQIQLVDTPSLMLDEPDSQWNNRIIGLARNADALLLVFSLDSPNLRDEIVSVLRILGDRGIEISKGKGYVYIERTRGVGDIKLYVNGRLRGFTEEDVRKLLREYRIYGANVYIEGEVTLDDVEKAVFTRTMFKPAVIVLNKADKSIYTRRELLGLRDVVPRDTPVLVGIARSGRGYENLGRVLFEKLGIIRIYTKEPNGEKAEQPLVLRKGATVLDVAKSVHSRLVKNFKYAKIWGPSAKYPGERTGLDHVVEDGDIVEIHA